MTKVTDSQLVDALRDAEELSRQLALKLAIVRDALQRRPFHEAFHCTVCGRELDGSYHACGGTPSFDSAGRPL